MSESNFYSPVTFRCNFLPTIRVNATAFSGWWKGLTNRIATSRGKNATLSIGALMDLLACGKMMGWDTGLNAGVRYQVKMKLIDEATTVQNRVILCKAIRRDAVSSHNGSREKKMELAHERLVRAYNRAHVLPINGAEDGKRKKRNDLNEPVENNNRSSITEKRTTVPDSPTDWCVRSLLTGVCIGAGLSLVLASHTRR